MRPFLEGTATKREKAIGFLNRDGKEFAWTEERYKYLVTRKGEGLYDIIRDPAEKTDLSEKMPEIKRRLVKELDVWKTAVLAEMEQIN